MLITLKSTLARSINLVTIQEGTVERDTVSLQVSVSYSDNDNKAFLVSLNLSVKSEQGFTLAVVFDAIFNCDDEIDDDFKKGHFPAINAPAIAYPYLRSLISTITVNAGYASVIIPTVNFKALNDQKAQSDKQKAIS